MEYKPYREVLYVLESQNLPTVRQVRSEEVLVRSRYPDVLFYTSYVLQERSSGKYLIVVNYRTRFAYLYKSPDYSGRVYYSPRSFRRQVGYNSKDGSLGRFYLRVFPSQLRQ